MDAALMPVILTYHSIADGRLPLEISPALFAEQMQWLKVNTHVSPLEELVTALQARQEFPERTVVLTFDDGFCDFYTAAAPVLQRLELPATVFLPTAHLGGKNDWPGQPAWVKPQPLMDWTQVCELAKRGIAFGSHSDSHPDLTKLSATKLESELEKSKSEIESRTGKPAAYFCYPYGLWNPRVRDATEVTYRGACATGAGVVEANADPFALPRVDAHYVRDMKRFRTLFTGGFVRYVTVRRWIRRLRGQPEGTYARA